MQNGPKTVMSARQSEQAGSFTARSKRWTSRAARPQSNGSQSAQRSYERYLALAQEEARSGNIVGAENYYQHAEHYFRLIAAAQAAQFQAQNGGARATGESGPGGLGDDDDDLGGLLDRFASREQQERQAFTDQTNAVVRAAPQPDGQGKPLVRREV